MRVTRKGRQLIIDRLANSEYHVIDILGFQPNEYGRGYAAPYSETTLAQLIEGFPTLELDVDTQALLQPSTRWKSIKGIELPSKRFAYPYQQVGMQLLLQESKFILAWEVGTGKTKPIVDAATYLIDTSECDFCLVFSEPSIAEQWARKSVNEDSDYEARYIWGKNAAERRALLKRAVADGVKFIIVDYYCTRVVSFMRALRSLVTSRTIIALDECHNVKSTRTQRFTQIYSLIKQAGPTYVWGATGSPVSQALEDFYGQAACVNEHIFGDPSRWFSFRAKFLVINPNNKHHVVGYRNVGDFMRQMHSMTHRVRKEDMLKDLPPLTFQEIELEMPSELRKVYDDYVDSKGVLEVAGKTLLIAENPLTRLEKARQICQGFYYETLHSFEDDDVVGVRETKYLFSADWHNPKFDVLETLLKHGDEAIIWYAYKEEQRQLARFLDKVGFSFLTLSSDVPKLERPDVVQKFQQGRAQILLSHPRLGGAGLNLQRARINIFFGHQSRVISREQAEGRSHRQGVKHGVTIYDLLWADTVERTVLNTVRNKRELARLVVDTRPEDFAKLLRGGM